jgi:UDPglucose 6-dehydrogenase
MRRKITIVGSGYVGMSISALLGKRHDIKILEVDSSKVEIVNNNQSTVQDSLIEKTLKTNSLSIRATLDKGEAYKDAEFIIIAAPTNFDENTKSFNSSSVDDILEDIASYNLNAFVVIKSTVPIGYTKKMQQLYKDIKIVFSPEFLREGNGLLDNLYPSRIIIGGFCSQCKDFVSIFKKLSLKENVPVLHMSSEEAESVKLFSNAYLAMRVSFFNELDSFALQNQLDTLKIINGVCSDKRIGDIYNNPSFGYGGYCLPKDTKQLLSDYSDTPQDLINAIINSNKTRKEFIASYVSRKNYNVIGIYRLIMKADSSNFRESAIIDIVQSLTGRGFEVIIYEPLIADKKFMNVKIENDLFKFKDQSEIILTNRINLDLSDVKDKVFSRDLLGLN